MNILDKIDGLEAKFHEVSLLITDPAVIADQARYVRLNRDYHDLERVLECAHRYKKAVTDLQDAKDLFFNESDPEMKEMAKAEIDELETEAAVTAAGPGRRKERGDGDPWRYGRRRGSYLRRRSLPYVHKVL